MKSKKSKKPIVKNKRKNVKSKGGNAKRKDKTAKPAVKASKQARKTKKINVNYFYGIMILIALAFVVIFMNLGLSGPVIKEGDSVAVWYVGKLQSGEVFDTNIEKIAQESDINKTNYEPLEFKVGEDIMIEGFENAIIGMKSGEKKIFQVQPEKAYGNYKDDLIHTITMDEFKESFSGTEPEKGKKLFFRTQDGRAGSFSIKSYGRDSVTLDFNHELAGKTLIFDVELVAINDQE